MSSIDEVQDKIDRFEKYVQVIADERDQLRRKVCDLELALELASSTATSRYNHWSYQTYLFFRWYFWIKLSIRRRWPRSTNHLEIQFELRTPLLGVLLAYNQAHPTLEAIRSFAGVYFIPNLPLEIGKELYRHGVDRSFNVQAWRKP